MEAGVPGGRGAGRLLCKGNRPVRGCHWPALGQAGPRPRCRKGREDRPSPILGLRLSKTCPHAHTRSRTALGFKASGQTLGESDRSWAAENKIEYVTTVFRQRTTGGGEL